MSKTKLTREIELSLYNYCYDLGQILVEEVTMGNEGIVDMLSLEMKGNQTKGYSNVWRFYEIKVSRQDFYSSNKLTFLGNFNYFVMPYDLYCSVKDDISKEIGVLAYSKGNISIVKKPVRKKELALDENILTRNLLRSMNREVFKAKQVEKGLSIYTTETLMKEIIKRTTKRKSDFFVDLVIQTYNEDEKNFVQLLTDNGIYEGYKEMILAVMSKEFSCLQEDVKERTKDFKDERRLKREAWLKIKELENKLNSIK